MRRFIASVVVVFFAFTLATAEDIGGRITKVEGGKITYIKGAKKGQKGEEATAEVIKDVKYNTGKRTVNKEDKKATYTKEKDLTEAEFTTALKDAGEKGLNVRLITADDGDNKGKVTEIRVLAAKKKAVN